RGAHGDEAAVAGRLELVERSTVDVGQVRLCPDDVAAAVQLLDQAALDSARTRAIAARPAADRAAAKHVAAARLAQRERIGVIAGRRAEAADLLLPLWLADRARLQQPCHPDAVRRRRRDRKRDPA